MGDRESRAVRLRYTATGALAALAVAGAIAGTVALADGPAAKTPGQSTAPIGVTRPSAPEPSASPQPFLNAVERLVANGTITATEGQALDREILRGSVDTQALASEGFSARQLQIVQQALANTKRALAPGVK